MRTLFLLLAAIAAPASAQGAGPYTVAETGRHYARLQEAVSAIGMGTATVLIAPGVHRDCAVQQGGRLTFRAEQPGTAIFDGVTCEDKAVLVLRGQGSVVDGLVFRHLRVGDGNGAGIRTEMGDLLVTRSMFLDSQEGILGGQPTGQRITIERSTFSGLGQCDESPSCAHSIYLANRGEVVVTHCRFERGRGGHYVKLRSPRVRVEDNSFDDSAGHRTNYMIDLPDGATGVVAGNGFVQGADKENWTAFITVAAESKTYPSAGLSIIGNDARLAPGVARSPAFVANMSGERLAMGANRLGPGVRAYEAR